MQETKDDLEGNNDSTTFYDNPTTDKSALISTSLLNQTAFINAAVNCDNNDDCEETRGMF